MANPENPLIVQSDKTLLDVTVRIDPELVLDHVTITVKSAGRSNLSQTFAVLPATGTPATVPDVRWPISIFDVSSGFIATLKVSGIFAGKEVVALDAEASISKVFGSEVSQRLARAGINIMGLYGMLFEGSKWATLEAKMQTLYLSSVSFTIGAGTSEIQRNIIATRGLNLPRS